MGLVHAGDPEPALDLEHPPVCLPNPLIPPLGTYPFHLLQHRPVARDRLATRLKDLVGAGQLALEPHFQHAAFSRQLLSLPPVRLLPCQRFTKLLLPAHRFWRISQSDEPRST